MGLDFSNILQGPDLLEIVRGLDEDALPEDVRDECLRGTRRGDGAKRGDWVVIWGGMSDHYH